MPPSSAKPAGVSPAAPGIGSPAYHLRALDAGAAALLGLVVVLLLRRYAGIHHDSVLYLGQAMALRWPDIYGADLAFAHGTGQDAYTLFPALVGMLLQWIAPASLFLWGTLAGLLLFAAAAWYCLRALLPAGQRMWAWLGVLCLPTYYGKTAIFGYSESFLTPRLPAEAACLLAIGLLARGRLLPAALALGLAAALHPLQAAAATIIAWCWLVLQDRRWLHAAWLSIPLLALAVAGVAPFDGLLRRLDPDWLFILRDNSPQLFLSRWDNQDVRVLVLDAAVLAYGWRTLPTAMGRWCAAGLAGLVLGIAATCLLVDALSLVLPAGLQLWRVHWLAHWLAMATLAALMYRDVRAGDALRTPVLALAAVLAWSNDQWIWLAPAALYVAWDVLRGERHARIRRLLGWSCALGVAVLLVIHVFNEFIFFRMAHFRLEYYAFDRRVLIFPFLAFALALLGVAAWNRARSTPARLLVAALLVPVAVAAALRWDMRSPENLTFERAAFRHDVFGVAIPPDAHVVWGFAMLTGPWLVLQRASYFSPHQIAGHAFNRELAIEGRQRLNRLYPLLNDYRGCEDRSRPLAERERCHISDEAMRQACAVGGGRRPDYLVLPFPQPQRALGTWTIRDPKTGEAAVTHRLYHCDSVLADLAAAPAAATGR